VIASLARPTVTRSGIGELTRTWTPETEPWAEVVVVHGLGEHSGRYERVGSIMADAGMRVESFDLIGFGATGGRRGDIESWALYLNQVEDHLAARRESGLPVVLLGHSMGGLIALEYCLSERPQPDALVISAPAVGGGQAWQRVVAPVLARVVPKVPVPNAIKGEQLSRDPAVGEAYFTDPLVYTSSTTRLGAELFTAMDRTRANLGNLSLPALVIHGGADTIVPPAGSAILGELPGVERRLHLTLRHESFNEPEGPEVVNEVVDWIRSTLT
jgi:alpha-beta hydrolase superfamily lysophospholipase